MIRWNVLGFGVLLAAGALSCAARGPARAPANRLLDDLERAQKIAAQAGSGQQSRGSLWTDASALSLVGDVRASRAGDLVTIRIVEDTKGSQQAKTDLNKDAQLSLSAPTLGGYEQRLVEKWPYFNPAQILETNTQKAFKGDGATTRETSVEALVTARVIGVYPSGDLAVVGHKDVTVNHERQVLTIVGIVRATDLSSDNSVSSTRLAELTMHLGGKGDVDDAQREGWLSRMIQKVWPF